MKTIQGDRGTGRTTKLIEVAAELQDEGYGVIYAVPQESWIDHLFPMMQDVLDMSRVEVHTQFGLRFATRIVNPIWVVVADDTDLWNNDNAVYLHSLGPQLKAIVV